MSIAEPNFKMRNSLHFITRVKNIALQGEIIISVDVSFLFPSVPTPQTLEHLHICPPLQHHLLKCPRLE